MGIMLSPETLQRFPLFAGLDHCMITALAMAGEKVSVKRGEWLFYEGDQADTLYVILTGAVELKAALDREKSCHVDLCTLVSGDLFGWSAVIEPGIYRLSAESIVDTTLAKWNGVELAALMTHHSEMGFKLMCRILQVVGDRLAEFCVRFASLIEGEQWQGVTSLPTSTPSNQN